MRLALKVYRVPAVLMLAVVAGVIATWGADIRLPLPSASGFAATPIRVFAVLGLCVVVARAVTSASAQGRLAPTRSDRAIAVGVVGAAAAAVGLGAVATRFVSTAADGVAVLTTATLLLGIQVLCGVLISSPMQAMAPVCFVLVASLLGRSQGIVTAWAWVLDPSPGSWAQLSGPVLLLVALFALLLRGFRASRGRG